MNSAQRVRSTVAVALVAAAALACASTPVPYQHVITAYRIVYQNTSDALDVNLDPATHAVPLAKFRELIKSARTRADLTAAWEQVPELRSISRDFLETKVFALAEKDLRWPATAPPDDCYVRGVTDATDDYLKGGGQ